MIEAMPTLYGYKNGRCPLFEDRYFSRKWHKIPAAGLLTKGKPKFLHTFCTVL